MSGAEGWERSRFVLESTGIWSVTAYFLGLLGKTMYYGIASAGTAYVFPSFCTRELKQARAALVA